MLLLAAAAGVSAQDRSDWERAQDKRNWREVDVAPPAYPRAQDLLPFFVSAAGSFEFFVDAASLSVGEDGVVRYTLVARSAQGAESVSYEGIRCSTREVRIYATGRVAAHAWSGRAGPWRRIEARSVQRWHNALATEYFCAGGITLHTAQEGVAALRRGGHPRADRAAGG